MSSSSPGYGGGKIKAKETPSSRDSLFRHRSASLSPSFAETSLLPSSQGLAPSVIARLTLSVIAGSRYPSLRDSRYPSSQSAHAIRHCEVRTSVIAALTLSVIAGLTLSVIAALTLSVIARFALSVIARFTHSVIGGRGCRSNPERSLTGEWIVSWLSPGPR